MLEMLICSARLAKAKKLDLDFNAAKLDIRPKHYSRRKKHYG
ncbi:hypothetical protein CEV32_2231 [Brucella rhizosphaerae]|uniref:Uncharacterized protein n=1 Tax=Brucella rhizosphaerae TaxID=571254 RepID=A0A256F4Y9_9HYPH|nr:hypothetical protein CEV32_2231 [Brucella rhizosphaerae]